ncbi:MAG: hypothetical protein MK192_08420 [Idiomarina sp.]|nr:hypothetical protein [Idiomarina sp.]
MSIKSGVIAFMLWGLLSASISAQECEEWRNDAVKVKVNAQKEKVNALKQAQLKKLKEYEKQAEAVQKLTHLMSQPQRGPVFDMARAKKLQKKALAAYNKSQELLKDIQYDSTAIDDEVGVLEELLVSACKRLP